MTALSSVLAVLAVIVGALILYGVLWAWFAVIMLRRLARGDFGDPTDLTEETR